MLKDKSPQSQNLSFESRRGDAIFIGWQKVRGAEPFALYNVTVRAHPSFGSTVTEEGLRKLNLRTPETPSFQEDV